MKTRGVRLRHEEKADAEDGEWFGVVAVDGEKIRSEWLVCIFYFVRRRDGRC